MRTKLNLEGSNRRVVEKLSQMPFEWLDAGSWRLPSGKALAEFALQSGFLAPLVFQRERSSPGQRERALPDLAMPSSAKHFGKGGGR